ncbi:hypothetical protein CN093_11250 [Sinorhizobium meliloti]|uniref:hypothetical protein n=1 Tax=Rhizobium meliloti TaxID=382 RepID=UPI000FD36CB4|nr:hypothetical protein [Sinorhizobium meliloti]RVO40408.1 hypothetical protein CN093_11250 [Sinorhizobium meliloti]
MFKAIAFVASVAFLSLAGAAQSQDKAEIAALIKQNQQFILPIIPLIQYYDKHGDLPPNADVDAGSKDLLGDAIKVINIVKEVKNLTMDMDVKTGDGVEARDVQIGISIGVALDMLQKEAPAADKANADWLDDVVKTAVIAAALL